MNNAFRMQAKTTATGIVIGTPETETVVARAIKEEINLWRDNMKLAINRVHPKPIETKLPFFQIFTWFNFGLNIAKVLPRGMGTAASAVATRAALPLAIANLAVHEFEKMHQESFKEPQKILNKLSGVYRADIMTAIDSAAQHFPSPKNEHYQAVKQSLLRLFDGHVFRSAFEAQEAVEILIRDSGVIVTNSSTIDKLVQEQFNDINLKISAVYEGIRNQFYERDNKLFISQFTDAPKGITFDPKALENMVSRRNPYSCVSPGRVKRYKNTLTPPGFTQVDCDLRSSSERFECKDSTDTRLVYELLMSVHQMEVEHINYGMLTSCKDTTFAYRSKRDQISELKRAYEGVVAQLEAEHRKNHPEHINSPSHFNYASPYRD
ncbi:hypothetical protein OLMES_1288 [Oleiphilus messinensis]|uniref:Uncharacterized protein n=1 Tax=Oleiphilus messinensis TaxID=141451 RepID=A0A1Y0I4F5_9GAMM|nr:hypothetical protein [Oleiphilus messinensis]ARU55367.1 hypothetical protein OLMES_1288 [Oleiphilus messinensis]